ncbi:MAG: SMP-30/gluconolactonase/LRE family protein [Bacteroidota bacterium]
MRTLPFILSILLGILSLFRSETPQQRSADPILFSVEGLSGPESVRYDPVQDVLFVSNFNEKESNDGFISKISPQGDILDLTFMTGSEEYPLDDPRGMFIIRETELLVADAAGVHAFDTRTGKHLRFYDFTDQEPGFLNDIAADKNGTVYVTDMNKSQLFTFNDESITLVATNLAINPNGIALDPATGHMILAPWREANTFYSFNPEDNTVKEYMTTGLGGRNDGIEFMNGHIIFSCQVDSSLYFMNADHKVIRSIQTPGRPADIGIDTKRNRVFVPYIALDKVDVWEL